MLQAIRENEFRAEAIGYRTVNYRTAANCLGALGATRRRRCSTRCGCATPGPTPRSSFSIMIDILLMVVIGGMGTMYGAAIGATIFVLAQNYLQDLMRLASDAAQGIPLLPVLLHPDRWLLWLGVLFIAERVLLPDAASSAGCGAETPRTIPPRSRSRGTPRSKDRRACSARSWRRRCSGYSPTSQFHSQRQLADQAVVEPGEAVQLEAGRRVHVVRA